MSDRKAYAKEYYKTHKEETKACKKEYYRIHREEKKEYRRIHKEERNIYSKEHYRTHKEEANAYAREYHKTHKEEFATYQKEYRKTPNGKASKILGKITRRKKVALTPTFLKITSTEIKELLQKAIFCPHCNRVFSEYLFIKKSLDHIIPVSKGGLDTKSNCQILCLTCNSKKNNKLESESFEI